MKVVILAGGLGSRLSEETDLKPKPMVEIGGRPILWHIMKIYSHYGINEFIICCGYKGYVIKEYFSNYFLHNSDVTFSLKDNSVEYHKTSADPWKITLIDTGPNTLTGGRLKAVADFLPDDGTFCFTYGDGLADIDINKLIEFHHSHGEIATITAVRPQGRYGSLKINELDHSVSSFEEKVEGSQTWINGGFFVLEKSAIDYIDDLETSWEQEPLNNLSREGRLFAFYHEGFWHPMDTLRDKTHLNKSWNHGTAPWKVW